MEESSRKYQLNKADLRKIGTGCLIAITGAGITYITDIIPNIEWGQWTPVVVAISSVLVNIIRKFITNYQNDAATSTIPD